MRFSSITHTKKGSLLLRVRDNKLSKNGKEKKIKMRKKRKTLFDKQCLKGRKSCGEKQRENSP